MEYYRSLHVPEYISKNKEVINFKKFAFKQNVLEVAAAVIIGASFNKAVQTVSETLIMPIVNYLLSSTVGNWRDFKYEVEPGLTFEVGRMLNSFADFILTAVILYIIYFKIIKTIFKDTQPEISNIFYTNSNEWENWYPK